MGQKNSSAKGVTPRKEWEVMPKRKPWERANKWKLPNRPNSVSSSKLTFVSSRHSKLEKNNSFCEEKCVAIGLLGHDFGRASDEDLPIDERSPVSSPDNPEVSSSIINSSKRNGTSPPMITVTATTRSNNNDTVTERGTFTRDSLGDTEHDENYNMVFRNPKMENNFSVENNSNYSNDLCRSDSIVAELSFSKRNVITFPATITNTSEINNNQQISRTGKAASATKCTPSSHRIATAFSDLGNYGNYNKKTGIQMFPMQVHPKRKVSSGSNTTSSGTTSSSPGSETKSGVPTTTTGGVKSVYANATVKLENTTAASSMYTSTKTGSRVTKSKREKKGKAAKPVHRVGCCKPVAPPVFIEAFNRYGGSEESGGRGRNGCVNPADRLKNVDVVEELHYYVPTPNNCSTTNDSEFDYYCVNECGEMELIPCPPPNPTNQCCYNPVKYSRRQRFNFRNSRDEDDEAPPFPWLSPQSTNCCCPCCRAGLRRNPNCCCPCCETKGSARASNSFDEIPVGKNPQIQPKNFDATCTPEVSSESSESSEDCEDLIPRESGLYFYNADLKQFDRREAPSTPPPLLIHGPPPPAPPPPPPAPKPVEIINMEPKRRKQPHVQPIIQPVLMNPPPCPPCCGPTNNCNCCNPPEPPPPNYVPVMMCGGYNGGKRLRACGPRRCPRPCPPPYCGPPPFYGPSPFQGPRPFPGPSSFTEPPPQEQEKQPPSNKSLPHSKHKKESEEEKEDSEESYEYDEDESDGSSQGITASVNPTEDETITTATPGRKRAAKR